MTSDLFIGLMSGTSMDGIDAALVEFPGASCNVIGTSSHPYPDDLTDRLRRVVSAPEAVDLHEIGALHTRVAHAFADAASALLSATGAPASRIAAIGSHGQTVLHRPDGDQPFSLQLGDAAALAARLGIPVVADVRAADIALGGQGAPLTPAFHRWAFADPGQLRAVVNIGGIANVTRLDPRGDTAGYDTGPGNVLLDQWCRRHCEAAFDADGDWAAGGTVDDALLSCLRGDAYFARMPPKSTGTDYFNLAWLESHLARLARAPAPRDVQATLSELTARTIASELDDAQATAVCGGGAFNADLMRRLAKLLHPRRVTPTSSWGIDPEWVEAVAFAWLARQRLRGEPTNIPSVTGARAAVSLGGIFLPPQKTGV
ncbi:MAG: anhydro-N-acetylmuramic acid kinase [Gammaproteobacteria bacterium]